MPTESATPPSRSSEQAPPSSRGKPATVRHPRGMLAPPLPRGAPRARRVLRGAYRLVHGLVLHDVLLAAPAMAFHFFLSLLPLLVFVGYVVGLIARRGGVETILSPLLDNLPDTAEALVKKEVERLAGAAGSGLGPAAAAPFLWIASGGTHGLMNAVENVVGAPRRPWWKKRLLALAWVLAALGGFAGASYAVVQWDAVVHPAERRALAAGPPSAGSGASRHHAPSAVGPHAQATEPAAPEAPRRRRQRILRSGGERLLALSLSVAVATLVLAAFYRLSVRHSRRVERRVLPGAVLAVMVWMVISWAFGVYVSSLAEYALFYGSLAAVAVLLVWLWLTSLAILVGAELNAQLEGLRD